MSVPTALTLGVTAAPPSDLLARLERHVASTPALVIELAKVESAYRGFADAFPGSPIFYALKANPDVQVANRLAGLGCGFEIASSAELALLAELGIEPSRIISSNTIKAPTFVAEAHEYGVRHFGFDSIAEIDKLARLAPGCEVSARLTVPNDGSDWPLDKKFGASPAEIVDLMVRAGYRDLTPSGISFHVGSQCREPRSWSAALDIVIGVLADLEREGIAPRVINIGGGMPVPYGEDPVPGAAAVAAAVRDRLDDLTSRQIEIWLEPGRALVGAAGTLVTEVIGVAEREGRRWVYLDTGIFHGLAEAMGGIEYRFEAGREERMPCTIAGPSCDSVDVITTGGLLPWVAAGDRIAIPSAGAYTTAYASAFNGFPGPHTVVVEAL